MKDKVIGVFKSLEIEYNLVEHPAIFTVEDEVKYGIVFESEGFKNLFLRNKKKDKFYLYCLPCKKRGNIKALENLLEEKKLCFGKEEELLEKLSITPGSVSVLNIIEKEVTDVVFLLDEEIKQHDLVGFHPNDNRYTVEINYKDIEKILKKYEVEYRFISVGEAK